MPLIEKLNTLCNRLSLIWRRFGDSNSKRCSTTFEGGWSLMAGNRADLNNGKTGYCEDREQSSHSQVALRL